MEKNKEKAENQKLKTSIKGKKKTKDRTALPRNLENPFSRRKTVSSAQKTSNQLNRKIKSNTSSTFATSLFSVKRARNIGTTVILDIYFGPKGLY